MSEPRIFYEDEAVTLWLGDCLDVLPLLEPVDHVITDPPYSEYVHARSWSGGSAHRDAAVRRDFGFAALDAATLNAVASEIARVVARWVLVFSDTDTAAEWRLALEARGLERVRDGAWVKLGAPPQFTGDRPAAGFEAITICHPVGRKKWNGGGSVAVWTHPIVAAGSGHAERLHTTQKPLALMVELVRDFTDEGETILDPFAGSGTTLVAAKLNGRKAIGIEKSEQYCAVAAKRLKETQPGRLFDALPRAKPQSLLPRDEPERSAR